MSVMRGREREGGLIAWATKGVDSVERDGSEMVPQDVQLIISSVYTSFRASYSR